jgi:hypothetical protein
LGKEKTRKNHVMDDGKYKRGTHEYQSDELQLETNESSGKMKIIKSVMRRQITGN